MTSTSPSVHCSTATWTIQLSPGGRLTVTAVPAIRALAGETGEDALHISLKPWGDA